MSKKVIIALSIAFFMLINNVVAQNVPPPIPPPPPPGLPIDGGVLLLFISGLIYGVKKLKK